MISIREIREETKSWSGKGKMFKCVCRVCLGWGISGCREATSLQRVETIRLQLGMRGAISAPVVGIWDRLHDMEGWEGAGLVGMRV